MRPLLPWQAGESFAHSDKRVVFVGKPHRGGDGEPYERGEPFDMSSLAAAYLRHRKWPYWSDTTDIADAIHGRHDLARDDPPLRVRARSGLAGAARAPGDARRGLHARPPRSGPASLAESANSPGGSALSTLRGDRCRSWSPGIRR